MTTHVKLLTCIMAVTAILAGCGGGTSTTSPTATTRAGSAATVIPAQTGTTSATSTTIGHGSATTAPPGTTAAPGPDGDPDAYCDATRRFVKITDEPTRADGAPPPSDDTAFDHEKAEADAVARIRATMTRSLVPLGEMADHTPAAIAGDIHTVDATLRRFLELTKDATTMDELDNSPELAALQDDPDLQAAADRISDYTLTTCGIDLDNSQNDGDEIHPDG